MMKLWTFLGVITTGLFFGGGGGGGGHLYYIYTFEGFFLRSKFRIGIFFGGCYMLNIFGVCLMFLLYFLG